MSKALDKLRSKQKQTSMFPSQPTTPAEQVKKVYPDDVFPGRDDPRVQQMICNALFDYYSVDDWLDSKVMPATIRLQTPRGVVYMTKSRHAYSRLVEAEKVVFGPLEVEKLAEMWDKGPMDDALIDKIFQTKTYFPGAKVDSIQATP